jgi:hypothetical protein
MTDAGSRWARLAPLVLLVALALALVLPTPDELGLADPDAETVANWQARLDALPRDPLVLVAFDPDLGTYAEIRPTVRTLVADLLDRDARLGFVSITPEGRALALAELDRLARATANPTRLVDLGFVPGAEAAIVGLTRSLPDPRTDNAAARRLAEAGLGGVDAIVVVGGNDLGPRSWVEQAAPRLDAPVILAVAPTILLPELQPYLGSGQLAGLIGTPRDGAGYRGEVELGGLTRLAVDVEPRPIPILVGVVVAIGVLGLALGRRLRPNGRDAR